MRINRFIAHAGVCARRTADKLVREGKIMINGKVHTELGYQVQPGDVVSYEGKVLEAEKKHYLILHKPAKYLTSVYDPLARPIVVDLIDLPEHARIYPVGRLDYLTTGLLILTNDGTLAKRLAHPSQGVVKKYEVTLDKPLTQLHAKQISKGRVVLRDGPVPVDAFEMVSKTQVSLSLHIGRNRIIRRLFAYLGYHVTQLTRTGYAHLTLQGLPQGKWRYLTEREVKELKKLTAVDQSFPH